MIALTPTMQQRVLDRLAADLDQVVSEAAVISAAFVEEPPPASAPAEVRRLIVRARADFNVIEDAPGGYRLLALADGPPDEIFERRRWWEFWA